MIRSRSVRQSRSSTWTKSTIGSLATEKVLFMNALSIPIADAATPPGGAGEFALLPAGGEKLPKGGMRGIASSAQGNAADQIFQIVVAPADSAAEREGGLIEDVVDAGAQEKHRRVRFLAAHHVL